ncbi:Heat shock protein 1 [Forsythia ovata]|uniref:Heat shock protein 1 n=1 Tax=Forsythia ovata TaxID=205694 RepID=A0ABD1WGE6_9LAMI
MSLIPSFFGNLRSNVFDPFSLDIWDHFESFPFSSTVDNVPTSTRETSAFTNARIDWKETPEAHIFKADLLRLKKEEVTVEVEEGGVLQISGEWSKEQEEKNDKWHRLERSSGKFLHRFRLPENANTDQVKASMENSWESWFETLTTRHSRMLVEGHLVRAMVIVQDQNRELEISMAQVAKLEDEAAQREVGKKSGAHQKYWEEGLVLKDEKLGLLTKTVETEGQTITYLTSEVEGLRKELLNFKDSTNGKELYEDEGALPTASELAETILPQVVPTVPPSEATPSTGLLDPSVFDNLDL